MEKPNKLELLIREHGYNLRTFAKKCNLPYTTLYNIIKKDIGGASVENVIIICKELGITVEELNAMINGIPEEISEPSYKDMELLIARNGKKLSTEEKMKLIKMLSQLE